MAVESTDIANKKRMAIYAKILDSEMKPKPIFLNIMEYEDGTDGIGEGLCNILLKEMESRQIPLSKVMAFGSDGASIMTGMDRGVAGRFRKSNPHMVNIHCMAHRLAFCTSQAASLR